MRNGNASTDGLDLSPQAADVLAGLPPAERERLLTSVEHARQASRTELDEAVEAMLGVVPRLVRGRARAVLVGRR